MTATNHDDQLGEIYQTMLRDGISFSCLHCCGRRGHGLWPSWYRPAMSTSMYVCVPLWKLCSGFSKVIVDTIHARWCGRGPRKRRGISVDFIVLALRAPSQSTTKIILSLCLSLAKTAGKQPSFGRFVFYTKYIRNLAYLMMPDEQNS